MSASAAQVNANRANAQLSTGPRSPEGVAACKYNALKFGLTAAEVVIKGEDPAAYDALRATFIETYKPASEIEAMHVERATISWWKMLRCERVEKILSEQLPPELRYLDEAASRKWNNFMRHKTSIEKSWRHASGELKQIAAQREKLAAAALHALPARTEISHKYRDQYAATLGSVLQRAREFTGQPTPEVVPPART